MPVRLRLLPFVSLVLLSGCFEKWEDCESKEGNFKCRMPGKVKKESRTQAFVGGSFTLFAHVVSQRDAAYMVGYADMPRKGMPFDYTACINAMTGTWGGKVEYQHSVTVSGCKGMEFEAKISQPADGWAAGRVFVHKNRIYQLLVLGARIRADSRDVQEFWNSFKLLKQ